MREILDARTIWTLSGVANRMAQGLGLHRDGSQLGLPVFETEMRRRLWWQLIILDFRSAELTGSGRFGDFWSDTSPPRNIDDTDFWPGITESEFESQITSKGENRATEMITCLLRCEFGAFWKEKLMQRSKGEPNLLKSQFFHGKPPSPWDGSLKERDETITELEQRLEEKFLRYCDVNIPLQFMASIIGRGAVASMRLMAHHPRRWQNESEIPPEERRLLWTLSIKLLESDCLCHSTPALQRFMWHTDVYFQWQALVYVLGELKSHHTGDDVDAAWRKVEEVYHHHPAFIVEIRKPLHAAVGSLCLKAWEARMRGRDDAAEKGDLLIPLAKTPEFIEMLREQRRMPGGKRKSTSSKAPTLSNNSSVTPADFGSGNASTTSPPQQGSFPTRASQQHTPLSQQAQYQSGFAYTPTSSLGYSGTLGRQPIDMSMSPPPPPSNNSNPNISPNPGLLWDPNMQNMLPATSYTYDPSGMYNNMMGDPTQIPVMPDLGMGAVDLMDWSRWDELIQEYDVSMQAPGPPAAMGGMGVGMGGGGGGGFGKG
jgi:hypothetical protein